MLKNRIWFRILSVAFFCLLPFLVEAQEDKIGAQIQSLMATHPYRFGVFRILPRLSAGTSYDSNVYSTSTVSLSDYYNAISPGGSFALKLGRRAYFVLDEDVNILWYQKQNTLNDVYNTTQATFGIGTRKLLLELYGFYLNKLARVDPEVDQPYQQRYLTGAVDLSWSLRQRTYLHLSYKSDDQNFSRVDDIANDIPPPPDTLRVDYGVALQQALTDTTEITFEGHTGYTDFTDISAVDPEVTDPRANFWKVLGGFNFRGKRLVGTAKAGLESRESTHIGEGRFEDLVIDTSVDYLLARRLAIGVFANRARRASALVRNDFRLALEAGVRGCVPVSRSLFVDGIFTFATNDYGPETTVGGVVVTQDDFRRFDLGMNVALPKNLVVRAGATYTRRISNVPQLDRDRFTLNVGVGLYFGRGDEVRRAPGCSPVSMSF